jgi:hypothetical protein
MTGYGQPGHSGHSVHGSNRQGDRSYSSSSKDSRGGDRKRYKLGNGK